MLCLLHHCRTFYRGKRRKLVASYNCSCGGEVEIETKDAASVCSKCLHGCHLWRDWLTKNAKYFAIRKQTKECVSKLSAQISIKSMETNKRKQTLQDALLDKLVSLQCIQQPWVAGISVHDSHQDFSQLLNVWKLI